MLTWRAALLQNITNFGYFLTGIWFLASLNTVMNTFPFGIFVKFSKFKF